MPPWYKDGLRFGCTGCGACCSDHDDHVYVYLTRTDVEAISRYLELSPSAFFEQYCRRDDGLIVLKNQQPQCVFLRSNRCVIYPVRPKQCSTWPFWTENLNSDTFWHRRIAPHCPGIGRGERHSLEEILKSAQEREQWYFS